MALTRAASVFGVRLAAAAAVVVALWMCSAVHYLLFHAIVELFSIVVASAAFVIAWHTRRRADSGYALLLGVAYGSVALLDLLHTLGYSGMGLWAHRAPNLPTQLWISARAVEAASLLLATGFVTRRPKLGALVAGYSATTALLLVLVFAGWFPDCFVEGQGLTAFKRVAEYVLVFVLALGAWALWRRRQAFDVDVLRLLLGAVATSMVAELSFTLYVDPYGFFNFAGHCVKLVSFFLVYKAIVETGLVRPFALLFRNLKRSEEELAGENERLQAMQRRLSAQNRSLARLNEEKNQLLGVAAHDIRSPLAVIRMYASLLAAQLPDAAGEQAREFVEAIERRPDYSLTLLARILDLAAIEAGIVRLEPRRTDLVALVRDTLSVSRPLAQTRGVELACEAALERADADVDPVRVEEALTNLLSNALNASPRGGRVLVWVEADEDGVRISVQDEGPGIAPEDQARVFAPFERGQAAGDAPAGTGLGLAIVRKVVEAHSGRVTVASEPGRGATFSMTLPRSEG